MEYQLWNCKVIQYGAGKNLRKPYGINCRHRKETCRIRGNTFKFSSNPLNLRV